MKPQDNCVVNTENFLLGIRCWLVPTNSRSKCRRIRHCSEQVKLYPEIEKILTQGFHFLNGFQRVTRVSTFIFSCIRLLKAIPGI